MDAIGEVSKAATEGATGTNDIAEKTGVVVEKAAEIKERPKQHIMQQISYSRT